MVFIEKEFDFEKPDNFSDNLNNYLRARCSDMGQEILNPIDVAGGKKIMTGFPLDFTNEMGIF